MVISDHHERRLDEAATRLADEIDELTEPPPTVVCDVTDEAQVQALIADASTALGGSIDVMVNNAGLGGTVDLVDMTDEQWSVVLDVTLTGTFRMTRAALRHMGDRGSGGVIGGPPSGGRAGGRRTRRPASRPPRRPSR